MNLSRVSAALCGPRCLVPRPHYSARPKRFRPCGTELTERDWENTVQVLGNGPRTFTYISRAI